MRSGCLGSELTGSLAQNGRVELKFAGRLARNGRLVGEFVLYALTASARKRLTGAASRETAA